ncbi:MAG: peptidoglycan DD-metalloendopeptidase family protein [Ruminococcus sp.]|nr:peptidoglycan DD-metalloendopeptidase family protein [Ruminococcus sp.]MDE6784968.1 peptidoglycan DD-metalloendopeptidase family protein [Ruminococcus sp.]
MYHLKRTKKFLAFLTCTAISLGIAAAFPEATDNSQEVKAKTVAEIEEQRKANAEKIAQLETQINSLEGSKTDEKRQQNYLNEQIGIIQNNIDLLNAELISIGNDISATETNIAGLDADIIAQQAAIDENIEIFKQHLCAMYVNGNDTSASIVLGSSSFYDMMSRVQMINRIADYEDNLIDSILTEIQNLKQSKSDLETEKLNLTMKLEEQQKRKEEKDIEIGQLNVKMQETEYEIQRIATEQSDLARDKEEIKAEQDALDAELKEIEAEIERQKAAAQKAWEEQQRKLWEQKQAELKKQKEEERLKKEQEEKEKQKQAEIKKQQEEEKRKKEQEEKEKQKQQEEEKRKQEQNNNTNNNSDTNPTPTEPKTEPPTPAPTQAPTEPPTEAPTEPETFVVPTVSESGFAWPCPGFSYITSYYGYRWGKNHNGIDVGDGGIMNGAAVASQSGTVITVVNGCTHNYGKNYSCGCGGGFGNYVVISHDGTYSTLYAHLSYASVSVGQYVNQNDVIGAIGSTGHSTGAHLHFEVRVNGSAQNPMNYVSP